VLVLSRLVYSELSGPGMSWQIQKFLISISSGDLNVLPAVALNFENLVAKVLQ